MSKVIERIEKECPSCNIVKPVEEFCRNKARSDGRDTYCKKCSVRIKKERISNNPELKEKRNSYSKKWAERHPEKYKETHAKYRERNKDKIAAARITPERREYSRKLQAERRKDPFIKMRHNISRQISHGLKRSNGSKRSQSIFDALEYSPEQLKEHLERQFDDKMNWDNYGSYWHIDHIIPHSSFNYASMQDDSFKECWKLDNLQPLEASENIRKGNKTPQ